MFVQNRRDDTFKLVNAAILIIVIVAETARKQS